MLVLRRFTMLDFELEESMATKRGRHKSMAPSRSMVPLLFEILRRRSPFSLLLFFVELLLQ